jgi:hypothetical protein
MTRALAQLLRSTCHYLVPGNEPLQKISNAIVLLADSLRAMNTLFSG